MRITPKEVQVTVAAAAEAPAQSAPAAAEKAAPAAPKGDRTALAETLRASKAPKAQDAGRNRGSAPEGSKAEAAEESVAEEAGTTTEQEAEGQEEGGAKGEASKSVRRRLRRANQAAKAATTEVTSEVAQLKAQVTLLTDMLSGKVKAEPQAPSKQKAIELPSFPEKFPENGTHAEQERWQMRKEAWDAVLPAAKQMTEGIVSQNLQQFGELLSPVLQEYVDKSRNSQFERARPIVEDAGFDFDEVVVEAQEVVKRFNNQIPMEAAIGMVLLSGQVETEAPAKDESKRKIPSRAATVSALVPKREPTEPVGVFGRAWRNRDHDMASLLRRSGRKPTS